MQASAITLYRAASQLGSRESGADRCIATARVAYVERDRERPALDLFLLVANDIDHATPTVVRAWLVWIHVIKRR
jgi:hypothetical protein